MTSTPESLVLLLHGVGSSGQNIGSLEEHLAIAGARFAAPNAPNRFDAGPSGYQWFSVQGVNDENRAERVKGARDGFDRLIAAEIERAGFADRLDRVAFFGFSQGAILSMDALARGRWPVAAVVAASGRLVIPPGEGAAIKTPVMILHGALDRVIPVSEAPAAEAGLKAAGFVVETHVYPGLGHTISMEGIAAARAFLARALG